MIEIEHLKKDFGDHQVLRGVDLRVSEGEIFVIIGPPSGQGKSTLLRIIDTLEKPTSGDVRIQHDSLYTGGGVRITMRCAKRSAWSSRTPPQYFRDGL
ncbi:ATP-binding cassette domain-containing protein [Methanogenium cariaci]|uniref:ATP-binding cassette domain-containing protein n=1 Tax=Methanogenium cariaci TaxID=2197 RepID=UPI0024800021|nr:ATP-binding cassette domain-containing protein [Methanogenium cariaci]